jgi:hypothetical protein
LRHEAPVFIARQLLRRQSSFCALLSLTHQKSSEKPAIECDIDDILCLDAVEFVVGHEVSMQFDEISCALPFHITPCVFSAGVSGKFSLLVVGTAQFTLKSVVDTQQQQ